MINTDENFGGAAVACKRLIESLSFHSEVEVKLLCLNKRTNDLNTKAGGSFLTFLLEKIHFIFFEKNKKLRFAFSSGKFGNDLAQHQWIKEADIIHLHWINQGFLSTKGVSEILKLNKPVFWTLHDMWPFTGGCHQSYACENYVDECGNCQQFLRRPAQNDLSFQVLREKRSWDLNRLSIIAVSSWMQDRIKKSSLLGSANHYSIPNPVNPEVFRPLDRNALKKKWNLKEEHTYVLFSAAIIDSYFKGFDLFLQIAENLKNMDHKLTVLFTGEFKHFKKENFPLDFIHLGTIKREKEMAEIYNISDIYVSTSSQESFSYTALEAVFCGTYVIAQATGEIGKIITDGKNGSLVKSSSLLDYIDAFEFFLEKKNGGFEKTETISYSYKSVAEKMLAAYKNELHKKNR